MCVCVCVYVCVHACARTHMCGHYSQEVLVFRGIYRGWRMVLLTHLASSTRATMPAARGADAEVPVCDWVQRLWMSTVTWKQCRSQNSTWIIPNKRTRDQRDENKRSTFSYPHTAIDSCLWWLRDSLHHTQKNSADGTTCYWFISTFRNMCMHMCRCAFSFPQ